MFLETYLTPTISDLLEKYFSNFDKQNFKLSWTGAATLNDLVFKDNAFDKNLPIKLVGGKVGTLVVSSSVGLIPFLSSIPKIELKLKDIYILAAPPSELIYNKTETEKSALESKRTELDSLEKKRNEPAAGPDSDGGPGYLQQLFATSLNNITLTLENIHIRFEDNRCAPPFSLGVTLKNFSIQSTDSNWITGNTESGGKTSFKVLKIDDLGLYLNPAESNTIATNVNDRSPEALVNILTALKDLLLNPNGRLNYILQPVRMNVKGKITLKPESLDEPFSRPRTDLDAEMPEFAIEITNTQNRVAIQIEDLFEAMERSKQYIEFRPTGIPYKGNAKTWWKFAYQGILVDVRRRRQNWDWNHIKEHRELCRQYGKAYQNLISQDNPSEQDKMNAKQLEDKLDNFNIILIRIQQDILNKRKKEKVAEKSKSLWFGTATLSTEELDKIMNEKFSDEEKAKLKELINDEPVKESIQYPDNYADFTLKFSLPICRIGISNMRDTGLEKCLDFTANGTSIGYETYPGSDGLKLNYSLDNIQVNGIKSPDGTSQSAILLPFKVITTDKKLLFIEFEKHNYANKRRTKRIKLTGEKLSFTYDAKSIQGVVDCFTSPPDVQLTKVTALTSATISRFENYSLIQIMKLLQLSEEVEVDVNLDAPSFVFPEDGELTELKSKLVINMGNLTASGIPRQGKESVDPNTIKKVEYTDDGEISPDVLKIAYNHYKLQLDNFEIILALPGKQLYPKLNPNKEDAKIQPTVLLKTGIAKVHSNQCIITDDTRFPSLKVDVAFPLFDFDISDQSILKVVDMAISFPFATTKGTGAPTVDLKNDAHACYESDVHQLVSTPEERQTFTSLIGPSENATAQVVRQATADEKFDPENATQFTYIDLRVHIEKFVVKISQLRDEKKEIFKPLIDFKSDNFVVSFKSKTFVIATEVSMGEIKAVYLDTFLKPNEPLYLFKTYHGAQGTPCKFTMCIATWRCPSSIDGLVKLKLGANISSVDTVLFENTLIPILDVIKKVILSYTYKNENEKGKPNQNTLAAVKEVREEGVLATPKGNQNYVAIKAVAELKSFTVTIVTQNKSQTQNKALLKFCIDNLSGNIEEGPLQTKVLLQLDELEILNLDTPTNYPKVLGAINKGEKLFDANIFLWKGLGRGELEPDADIKILIAPHKVFLLGSIIDNLLSFANKIEVVKIVLDNLVTILTRNVVNLARIAYGTNDTKISIDLKINAPIFYLPRNTMSNDAIVCRLGHIQVNNKLSTLKTASGRNAILDNIQLQIHGIEASSCFVISETEEILSEIPMVEPVSFNSTVTRNLSTSWYPDLPLVKIAGIIDPAVVSVSVDDLVVLYTNLGDIFNAIIKNYVIKFDELDESVDDEGTSATPQAVNSESSRLYVCVIDLDITLQQLGVTLYASTPSLAHLSGKVKRDESSRFSILTFDTIPITWSLWNTSDYKFKIYVKNAVLEDTRTSLTEVTKFLERKHLTPNDENDPIGLFAIEKKILATSGKAYKVDFSVASFELIMNINYANFILTLAQKIVEQSPILENPIPTQPNDKKATLLCGEPVKDEPTPMLDCTIRVPGVVLLLLENANSKDTNAIMAKLEANIDVKSKDDESHGGGHIKFSLNSAKKNPGIPTIPLAQIVSPTVFSLDVGMTQTEGINIGVDITPFSIRLSTGTVLIISKIVSAIYHLPVPGRSAENLPDYTNVWDSVENSRKGYWFLRTKSLKENAKSVLTKKNVVQNTTKLQNALPRERITLKQFHVDTCFEVGTGVISTPMVLINWDLTFQVLNWSRNLYAAMDLKISASYNSTHFGVWEFLMEPLEIPKPFGDPGKRWFDGHIEITKPEGTPNITMNLYSTDIVEVTVSKTAVAIVSKLIHSYVTAALEDVSENDVKSPPYIFKNDTGFDLIIDIENTPFIHFREDGTVDSKISISTGDTIDLGLKPEVGSSSSEDSKQLQRTINVTIPKFEFQNNVIIAKETPRYFELNIPSSNGQKQGLLFDIVANRASSIFVTARSIVEIINELRVPVGVYNATNKGSQLIKTMQPHSRWALPFSTVYEESDGICFKADGYEMGVVPFPWQDLRHDPSTSWETVAKPENGVADNANIKIIAKGLPSVVANSDKQMPTGQNCKITLKGQLLINNLLQTILTFESLGHTVQQIPPGLSANIFNVTPNDEHQFQFNLKISGFRGRNWVSKITVQKTEDVLIPAVFTSEDGTHKLCFGYKQELENDLIAISVYCPYWMVNYTELPLNYKSSSAEEITNHAADKDGFLMYAYEKELGQEKTVIQCNDSEWSSEINLDTAGLTGGIICTRGDQTYELTTEIILSKCNLTKIIKFKPRTMIVNTSPLDLVFNETDKPDSEISIKARSAVPFWPSGTSGQFNVKVKGTDELSIAVYYNRTNDAFVKLDNKYGGLHVVVHVSEMKVTITFNEFMPGEVPLLIVNDTQDIKLTYNQHDTKEDPAFLDSGESILYTWYDLTNEDKTLDWGPAGYKETVYEFSTLNLDEDAKGEFKASNGTTYNWISIRSGVQRILVVTPNEDLIESLSKISSPKEEVPLLSINLEVQGFGVSLVNNDIASDILYIRAGWTPPIWEGGDIGENHFKIVDPGQSSIIEQGYQDFITGKITESPSVLIENIKYFSPTEDGHESCFCSIETEARPACSCPGNRNDPFRRIFLDIRRKKMAEKKDEHMSRKVDFRNFQMIQPTVQQLKRHDYKPGVRIKLNRYSLSTEFDLRLGTLQVDNQLPSAIYPRTFIVSQLPKTVTLESEVHPSILILKLSRRTTPESNVNYISGQLILQEFNVAADLSLINAMIQIVSGAIDEQEVTQNLTSQYKSDSESASQSVLEHNKQLVEELTAGQIIFVFEDLKLYKLKFNVTLALSGGSGGTTYNPFLVLGQGLGAAFGNITDKPFNIDGISFHNVRFTLVELGKQIVDHYASGIIKNVYTVVLELDVIGNPFKLLTGLGSGIGALLTEPIEGALHGNLLEGVSNGVGTLVDSTLGNISDSISKISGSLSRGADALGLHIIGGIAGGISGLFGGIKMITHGTEKMAIAVRPPRVFRPKSYLEPYSLTKARGIALFNQVHISYPDTGEFLNHVFVTKHYVILFTEKMAFHLSIQSDDPCKLESALWGHTWNEFADISSKDTTNIDYDLKDHGNWLFQTDPHLLVEVSNPETYTYVLQKSQELLQKATK